MNMIKNETIPAQSIKAWLTAIRLPTLLIPTIQVGTATGVAIVFTSHINWRIAFYAWLVAVLITIGTNLINDAIDFKNGGDPINHFERKKVIPAGLLTLSQVYMGGLLALALACAIPFALDVDKLLCFGIVLLSAICGYCYTGGPYPISYLGLSEIFIFIFYGGVCVTIPFYAQTYQINAAIILAACQMGMLAILPNALNNFRDIYEDKAVHKHTLAVRFGKEFARWEISAFTIIPFIINICWLFLGFSAAALMPLLLLPLVFMFLRGIWKSEPSRVLNKYFGVSVMIHFSFGILLIIGLLIA